MATHVRVETAIDRPREEVAAYATAPANDREWIGALTDVRLLTDASARRAMRRASTSSRARLLARAVKRSIEGDLARLKTVLESETQTSFP